MKSVQSLRMLLTALFLTAGISHGALIIYEPFGDTEANLSGNSPGVGLTGTYIQPSGVSGSFSVSGSSLSYGSQPTSGGSASYVGPTSAGTGNISNAISTLTGAGTSGSLENAGLLADGAVLWFSVLQRTTNNTAHDGFAFALGSDSLTTNTGFTAAGAQGVGFAIDQNGNLMARVSTAQTTYTNGTTIGRFTLPETILIVGKITWGASSDTVELYLPDTSLNLGSVQSTATAAVNQSAFDTLTFHTRLQGSATLGANTDVALDEIRFGSTLADVLIIPEPSNALLGGLGLLLLLRRRRSH